MKNITRHQGIVEKIDNNTIAVRIEQQSACSACHARKACLAADKKEKIIEVTDSTGSFKLDDKVDVLMQTQMGREAVIIAFVLPILLVIAALIAGFRISGSEAAGGLAGLAILVPYYLILYFLRDKLKKRFVFTISKR